MSLNPFTETGDRQAEAQAQAGEQGKAQKWKQYHVEGKLWSSMAK
jgi:hypothetical protein